MQGETDPSEFRLAQDTVIHTEGDPVKREDKESNLATTILVAGANQWHKF
ncbi:hypothetical protein PILCRDRAFT_16228 [Piloderma croceum F 1598]|uniref:Uncharacterized protein n=1 Tax=Piloderma croceum (strain F 1598) TaxID=765440 RepID=A0A0C3EX57_PILCF|nr:hypothetical protein PILCRDRAFT_16228 [Piloderma croceum F 1598]